MLIVCSVDIIEGELLSFLGGEMQKKKLLTNVLSIKYKDKSENESVHNDYRV